MTIISLRGSRCGSALLTSLITVGLVLRSALSLGSISTYSSFIVPLPASTMSSLETPKRFARLSKVGSLRDAMGYVFPSASLNVAAFCSSSVCRCSGKGSSSLKSSSKSLPKYCSHSSVTGVFINEELYASLADSYLSPT